MNRSTCFLRRGTRIVSKSKNPLPHRTFLTSLCVRTISQHNALPHSRLDCASQISCPQCRHRTFATSSGTKASLVPPTHIRNLAIIAHVDHGKTTLVDGLLRQSSTKINSGEQRVMDRNELEKERGITILSKCTSIVWDDPRNEQRYQLNIVDTPGRSENCSLCLLKCIVFVT